MALPDEGPCSPWCTWDQVLSTCSGLSEANLALIDALPDDVKADLIDDASSIVYELNGRRYPGECEQTRRICMDCRLCRTFPCCCDRRDVLDLGSRFPISSITTVTLDGVELVAGTDYDLRDRRYLRRLGDTTSWPRCADIADAEAFTVTWKYGRNPPGVAQRAVARFVAELAKKCVGIKCELPQRVTTVQREQVTYTIIDSFKMLDDGKVGFLAVDLWLAADKRGRRVAPGVFDPDGHATRHVVSDGS